MVSVKEEVIRLIDGLREEDLLVVKRLLRGLALPVETEPTRRPRSEEERRARVQAALGSMAHVPGSVDDFLREKHEDIEREEERYWRRHPEEARVAGSTSGTLAR